MNTLLAERPGQIEAPTPTPGFSLRADCGQRLAAAEAFARHFEGLLIPLEFGTTYRCRASTHLEGNCWWVDVVPEGRQGALSPRTGRPGEGGSGEAHPRSSGIVARTSDSFEVELTDAGFALYAHLHRAPPYRYARAGIEPARYPSANALAAGFFGFDRNGAVLANSLWQRLGWPDVYVPFTRGYRWRPFVRVGDVE